MVENISATGDSLRLPSGALIPLPVEYTRASAMMAHFPAPTHNVQKLLPSNRLNPVQLVPGYAIVSLCALEYPLVRGGDPYNEFIVMIPVQFSDAFNAPALPLLFPSLFKTLGLYVHRMPVTSRDAYDLGVGLWGYPKFIAQIDFEDLPERRRCHLRADDRHVLTMDVEKVPTSRVSRDYFTYTVKDGRLLRTRVEMHGMFGTARFRGGASCILGDHPVADELRALKMAKSAVERLWATDLHNFLHAPAESWSTSL